MPKVSYEKKSTETEYGDKNKVGNKSNDLISQRDISFRRSCNSQLLLVIN